MSTLKDLYRRVAAALEGVPASVKADVDSAFMEHVKANPDTAYADSPDPAPVDALPVDHDAGEPS